LRLHVVHVKTTSLMLPNVAVFIHGPSMPLSTGRTAVRRLRPPTAHPEKRHRAANHVGDFFREV
jgi:hypothetical protein